MKYSSISFLVFFLYDDLKSIIDNLSLLIPIKSIVPAYKFLYKTEASDPQISSNPFIKLSIIICASFLAIS